MGLDFGKNKSMRLRRSHIPQVLQRDSFNYVHEAQDGASGWFIGICQLRVAVPPIWPCDACITRAAIVYLFDRALRIHAFLRPSDACVRGTRHAAYFA